MDSSTTSAQPQAKVHSVTHDIRLRSAEKSDQSTIRALVKEGGINPFGLHWQNFILAIDANDMPIGCGQLKPHAGIIELASIAVTHRSRGSGVARQIIEHLLIKAPTPTWLMCDAQLANFYTKFGFRRVSDRSLMPAYFRRIDWFVALGNRFVTLGDVAIMVWPA